MGIIEETLQTSGDLTWQQAAFHLVVTGDCHPEIKDWLIDQLGERGHKRWEKATVTGYESIRRLSHECLLPALERFTVILSRLRGLTKFHLSNVTLGLSTRDIDRIIDTANSLQLVAHNVIINSAEELRQFVAFSTWLHQEIMNQAQDPSNSELAEKGSDLDHIGTLEFIEGPMKNSQLLKFFEQDPQLLNVSDGELNIEEGDLFALYKREIGTQKQSDARTRRLPKIDALIRYLSIQCEKLFKKIMETQKRSVGFGSVIDLLTEADTCTDMRISAVAAENPGSFNAYVISKPSATRSTVCIYKATLDIENGISSTRNVEYSSIQTAGISVQDAKFVDDYEIMLAIAANNSSKLLRIPYTRVANGRDVLRFTAMSQSHDYDIKALFGDKASVILTDPRQMETFTWREFPSGLSWTPRRLEINGREGRRAVCVHFDDGLHYRIFGIDNFPNHDQAQIKPDKV